MKKKASKSKSGERGKKREERQRTLQALTKEMLSDKVLRKEITSRSHWWFFNFFLGHYITHPTALFQREMFLLSEERFKLLATMAFRGSGKSTILNLSLVLWSILGIRQKKCILIVSRSRDLVATHIRNIKEELENNKLLRSDLGPFKEDHEKYGTLSLILPHMDTRIFGIHRGQSIRGIRHGPHRPDLIICDDLDDSSSVATPDELEATQYWFRNEVKPAGDNNTEIVVLGNLLHKESLLMHLRGQIERGDISGIFRAYPLIDNNGKSLWSDKFSSEEIESLKASVANQETWRREYMLVLPYDEFYDSFDSKKFRTASLKTLETERMKIGNSVHSAFLREAGFRISAPYGQSEFSDAANRFLKLAREEEERKEAERKSRPPTPTEIRAEKEQEATRLRPADYESSLNEEQHEPRDGYVDSDSPTQRYFDELARKAARNSGAIPDEDYIDPGKIDAKIREEERALGIYDCPEDIIQ